MCPACIASATMVVAGVGSSGGVLAVCIARWRKRLSKARRLSLFRTTEEE
jgi:hypothetical protein